MNAIVTICTTSYKELLQLWLNQVRTKTRLPIFIIAIGDVDTQDADDCHIIKVNPAGNPFPAELPDHACAEKLRLFNHLPKEVSNILFLDIDLMVLNNFWDHSKYFKLSDKKFIACQDLFIGYKEKMEDEFRPYDNTFQMQYFPDHTFHYFNTGVFFASKSFHAQYFSNFLKIWKSYVKHQKKYPSIFDQNLINYCLIKHQIPVQRLALQNNVLRQYSYEIKQGTIYFQKKPVNAMHFNGGDEKIKVTRWQELQNQLS